jgi:hypothetical protein
VTVKLTSPALGEGVGYEYTGPLEAWLKLEGYAVTTSATPESHLLTTAALPADDPTLAINREAAGQPFGLSGRLATVTASAIAPATGLAAGGTEVTITGDHMVDVTGITFGGVAATEVVVVDDQHVTCTTPAHAAGAVDVIITDSDGSVTKTAFYTYT